MKKRSFLAWVTSAVFTVIGPVGALAQDDLDLVKVASAQRGLWTTTVIHFANEHGIFEKHGIELDIY